jgi:hypothetical protein
MKLTLLNWPVRELGVSVPVSLTNSQGTAPSATIAGLLTVTLAVPQTVLLQLIPNLAIDATHLDDPPPNPPILGDFRAKTVSKSPRIGGFRGPAIVATIV